MGKLATMATIGGSFRPGLSCEGICLLNTPPKGRRSYWIPGSYAPSIVREAQLLFKAIEKEGLQGGKGDNNWVVRHRQIPRPWNPTRAKDLYLQRSRGHERRKGGKFCHSPQHHSPYTHPGQVNVCHHRSPPVAKARQRMVGTSGGERSHWHATVRIISCSGCPLSVVEEQQTHACGLAHTIRPMAPHR